MPRFLLFAAATIAASLLTGCAPAPYVFRSVPGRTGTLSNGYAIAPPGAPAEVQAAIAAGNRIVGLPYRRGGGHRVENDTAYDCSGATSYVLRATGKLRGSMPSRGFRHYGKSGPGKWISVYARRGHVFLVIAGLRFDTGYASSSEGPQWTTRTRTTDGSVIRHPPGL